MEIGNGWIWIAGLPDRSWWLVDVGTLFLCNKFKVWETESVQTNCFGTMLDQRMNGKITDFNLLSLLNEAYSYPVL